MPTAEYGQITGTEHTIRINPYSGPDHDESVMQVDDDCDENFISLAEILDELAVDPINKENIELQGIIDIIARKIQEVSHRDVNVDALMKQIAIQTKRLIYDLGMKSKYSKRLLKVLEPINEEAGIKGKGYNTRITRSPVKPRRKS